MLLKRNQTESEKEKGRGEGGIDRMKLSMDFYLNGGWVSVDLYLRERSNWVGIVKLYNYCTIDTHPSK